MKTYGVFSFSSSHHAIAAEAVTADAVIASGEVSDAEALETSGESLSEARLIPLPPEISAGCGLVLRVNEEGIKMTSRLLTKAEIPYTGTYLLKIETNKRLVEKYDLS
ncbi:DUF3343 domain-containing protein [Treponema denticola]|uniref:Putative Se/S carrier protein-like domain-containing protein n=1 Tax=Treponema denticola SP33 TaxID=999437 RepID=M2AWK9_TREDN|nr:DUF3343 domain-containing protein [Treponema denticola]EMB27741.1 hypothetical protein HMPREF9733_00183 [Treponema denticola SP33]EPF36357.1 hypothetical protein HMPREF9732_01723 [Treponema denticola SP32]